MEDKGHEEEKGSNLMVYDFTKKEIDYIKENANFTEIQENIFDRLTDKKGRQTIIKISMEENISTATVSRIIKQIKRKIIRVL